MIERRVAEEVKLAAEAKVVEYMKTDEFNFLVETFKRREREKILLAIQLELSAEREEMILKCRQEMIIKAKKEQIIVAIEKTDAESEEAKADAILLQNKLKMEEQQRKAYEVRVKEEADRLQEVLDRKQAEVCFRPQYYASSTCFENDMHLIITCIPDRICWSSSGWRPCGKSRTCWRAVALQAPTL